SKAQTIIQLSQSLPTSATHPMLNHLSPRGFHFDTTTNTRDLSSREYHHHFYPHAIHNSANSNAPSLCQSHHSQHNAQTIYHPHSLQRDTPTGTDSSQPPIINNL
ncbi:7090_t:CDS:1, partial [Acaulospora colombiana]